jgi:hypothetical protein
MARPWSGLADDTLLMPTCLKQNTPAGAGVWHLLPVSRLCGFLMDGVGRANRQAVGTRGESSEGAAEAMPSSLCS